MYQTSKYILSLRRFCAQMELVPPSPSRSIFFFPCKVWVLISLFAFLLNFTRWPFSRTSKSIIRHALFFVDYHEVWLSGRDEVICLYLKIPRSFYASFSRMDSGLSIYRFYVYFIIIIIYPLEFFTSALADGLSLEIE